MQTEFLVDSVKSLSADNLKMTQTKSLFQEKGFVVLCITLQENIFSPRTVHKVSQVAVVGAHVEYSIPGNIQHTRASASTIPIFLTPLDSFFFWLI